MCRLIDDVREPLFVRPGIKLARVDSDYTRGGMAKVFMSFEQAAGALHLQATERKWSVNFARFLQTVSDGPYPTARRSFRCVTHLSTLKPEALYEAFDAAEAQCLFQRFEWQYTHVSCHAGLCTLG